MTIRLLGMNRLVRSTHKVSLQLVQCSEAVNAGRNSRNRNCLSLPMHLDLIQILACGGGAVVFVPCCCRFRFLCCLRKQRNGGPWWTWILDVCMHMSQQLTAAPHVRPYALCGVAPSRLCSARG